MSMLGFAVQPPSQTRPGVPLYPPVTASLSSNTSTFIELSQTWAFATLIHKQSGEVLHEGLRGRIADSAHPLPDQTEGQSSGSRSSSSSSTERDRAYFYFPDLVIDEPGNYRIRVSLMEMDSSQDTSSEGVVCVRETIDSRSIIVEENPSHDSRPDSQERAFLKTLRDDDQDVPSRSR